ncbi:helix-turn-helix domain-containing protein [Sporosarcina sp. P13]|uniref:helix-turn-helix domain-containing protein n=1 Tax=Sporosarcina sp. P13 TaxID=2048263 RepID=UPI0013043C8A|nr:helix-turn-helix domain-containing protein [Sporosarcina sp. P13]
MTLHTGDSDYKDILHELSILAKKPYHSETWNTFRSTINTKLSGNTLEMTKMSISIIENTKKREYDLRFSTKTLEIIQQINTEVSSLAPLDKILKLSTDRLRSISKATIALIAQVDSSGKKLQVTALSGSSDEELQSFQQPLATGICGEVVKQEKVYAIPNIEHKKNLNDPLISLLYLKESIRSLICAPLVVNKELIGIFIIAKDHPNNSSPFLLDVMIKYCNQTAIAINNARLYANELRVSSMHKELFQEAFNQGYSGIVGKLSDFLNEHILLTDELGNVIDAHISQSISNMSIENIFDLPFLTKKVLSKIEPYSTTTVLHVGKETSYSIFPILLHDKAVAYLIIPKIYNEWDHLDLVAIEQAKNILSLKFTQEHTGIEVENRLRLDYVYDLILGLETEEDLLRRARYLKISFQQPRQIIILTFKNHLDTEHLDSKRLSQFSEKLQYDLGFSKIHLSTIHGSKLVIIVPVEETDLLTKNILSYFKENYPTNDISIGISNAVLEATEYVSGYNEAKKAAQFVNLFGEKKHFLHYNDLGIIGVIFESSNYTSLRTFKNKYLGKLINYEGQNKSDLIQSLQVFLDNESAYQATAKQLHVHYNTLRYRIERVEEIIQLDLSSAQNRLNLQIALAIHQLLDSLSKNTPQ